MHLLKVFFFIGLSYVATKGQNGPAAPKGDECVRRITTQVSRYFWKLQSRRIDYRERNNRIFADIPFTQLTTVYGWTIRGKTGRISQAREDGRGIITEYMVQFLSSDGNWTFINNSKTGKEMFTNLGNIAIPDTATSVTLSNPVKTLVLRVIPELWDGVPFMMMSIQHCADTLMAEQRPILPLQIQHNSVKKNLEDQIKKRIKGKISNVMKKVKQLKQRIDHYKGHGVKEGKKAGKYKSSAERNRVNHRKNKSRRKHPTHQDTEQKKLIIKTHSQPRSTVEKKSLDKHDSDIFGRFQRGDYFGDLGYKYRREHRDAPKRKNSKKKPIQQRQNSEKKAIQQRTNSKKKAIQQRTNSKKNTMHRGKNSEKNAMHRGKNSKKNAMHRGKKSKKNAMHRGKNSKKNAMRRGKRSKKKTMHQRKKSENDGKKKQSRARNHKMAQQKIKNKNDRKKQSKAKNHKMAQTKSKAKKKLKPKANKHKTMHRKSKLKGGQNSHQTKKPKTRTHTNGSKKNSHKLDKNKKRKQKTLQTAKGQMSRQQTVKSKSLSRLIKNIKKTEKNLSNLKKQLHTLNQKTPKSKTPVEGNTSPKDKTKLRGQESGKGGAQGRDRKPSNGKPRVQGQHSSKGKTPARKPYTSDITPSNNVKTKTETIAPAKVASSQKLLEMQKLEKENTALSESVYGSCRLRPVWRYNKAIFRPEDTFSAMRDVRQAWRAMYGLGIQPYIFRIPERFQKFRNQKYYLEIDFPRITNVFGLKVAGSSSQLQWGAVTRFSLYHKRKDSEPWQSYVDRLNQPRVFDVGTREKGNAHAPSVFRLDVPVTAKAIRIYPERWASAPIMMVDLITCETSYKH